MTEMLLKKVSSEMVLYLPTSPNYCFCTALGNRKPSIFSLKRWMLLCQKTQNTFTWSQLNHPSTKFICT